MPKEKVNKTWCCVFNCNRSGNDRLVSFHLFPKTGRCTVLKVDPLGLKERIDCRIAWEMALKMDRKASDYMRVCSNHFELDDFITSGKALVRRRVLKKNAVPSKNLPRPSNYMVKLKMPFGNDERVKVIANSNGSKIEPIVDSELDTGRIFTAPITPCADIDSAVIKSEPIDAEIDGDVYSCAMPFADDYSAIESKVDPNEFKIEPEDLKLELNSNIQDIPNDTLNFGQSEMDNTVDPLSLEGLQKTPISDEYIEEIQARPFKNVQGKVIEPDKKQMIFEVFLDKLANGQSKSQSVKLTAKETGFSERSVWRMITEKKTIGNFSSPLKTKQRKSMYEKLNEVQLNTVRQLYQELFLKSEPPTLRNILEEVNRSNMLPRMSRDTLWKLLKRLELM